MVLQHTSLTREAGMVVVGIAGGRLTLRGARELVHVLDELHEDRDVRVVLLEADGPDFCSGAGDDLESAGREPDAARALARLTIPIVAVVRGRVASVGLELALAADLRVAALDSCFALPEVMAGRLPSWGGTQRLPRVVGRATATAMLLLGEELDASTALTRGLVYETDADPGSRGRAIADALLRRSPLALEFGKEAVLDGSELPMREGMRLEATLNIMLQGSEDRAEGLDAFFAKREPSFDGR